MTLVQNNFEGGSQGTTITPANSGSGSGDAFATITGPFVFDSTGAYHGLGGRVQIATSTAWRDYHSWASVTQVAARVVFVFNGSVPTPAGGMVLLAAINATSFASVFKFGIDNGAHLLAENAAGGTLQSSSPSTLSAGTAYVLEYQIQPGTTITTGVISCQAYAAATPGTLLINFSSSTANLGTVAGIVRGSLGENDAVTTLDITFDEIVYNTGTLTAIGVPPTYAPAAVAAATGAGEDATVTTNSGTNASAGLAAATGVPPGDTADAIAIGMTI
jgi:hypothetical protein